MADKRDNNRKVVDKTTKTAKKSELVQISRREQRLRERLLTVDEDTVHDEKRLHDNSEQRKARLTRKINATRARQEQRLDRQERSVVYHLSPLLYRLLTPFYAIGRGFKKLWGKITGRVEHHRQVTPHRSFYLTTHAQAVRQINISGYLRFTHEVGRLIWDNKRLYLKALIVLTIALLTVIGFGVKDNYVNVREALQEAGLNGAFQVVGLITQAVITSLTVTNVNNQSYALLLALVAWMALIYIVRHIYGGRTKMKLRDAIYNSAGPFVSLLTIIAFVFVQLLPLAFALISYSAVTGAGYINEGIEIENMAAWCVIAVITILTVYWMVTSLLTMITVTIPGIYPLRAYFETSVLVSGRRVKILLRVLMMFVPLILLWLAVLIPTVSLDAVIKFDNFPFVQLITTTLVAASFIWISVYLYMLYRRLLDSPEQPAGTPNGRFIWPWQRKRRQAEIARRVDNEKNAKKDDAPTKAKNDTNPTTKKLTDKKGGDAIDDRSA